MRKGVVHFHQIFESGITGRTMKFINGHNNILLLGCTEEQPGGKQSAPSVPEAFSNAGRNKKPD